MFKISVGLFSWRILVKNETQKWYETFASLCPSVKADHLRTIPFFCYCNLEFITVRVILYGISFNLSIHLSVHANIEPERCRNWKTIYLWWILFWQITKTFQSVLILPFSSSFTIVKFEFMNSFYIGFLFDSYLVNPR